MSVLIRLGFVLGWCLSGHAFTRPGEGAMGNGIRPLEKTLGVGGAFGAVHRTSKGYNRPNSMGESGHVRLLISQQVAREARHGKEIYPHFGLMMVSNAT